MKEKIIEELNRITTFARSQKTYGEFFNVAFVYVEVIESNKFTGQLVKNTIDKELKAKSKIDVALTKKEIDYERSEELYPVHVHPGIYHDYYAWMKTMHDVVKRDKSQIEGYIADNMGKNKLFIYDVGRKIDLHKKLSKRDAENEIEFFEECHKRIVDLISGSKEEAIENENVIYEYDLSLGQGYIKYDKHSLKFERDRAKVINYFYRRRQFVDEYKTYKDVCNDEGINIDSVKLRQDVKEINKRVFKETDSLIKEILKTNEKEVKNDTNEYRWKIKV